MRRCEEVERSQEEGSVGGKHGQRRPYGRGPSWLGFVDLMSFGKEMFCGKGVVEADHVL